MFLKVFCLNKIAQYLFSADDTLTHSVEKERFCEGKQGVCIGGKD